MAPFGGLQWGSGARRRQKIRGLHSGSGSYLGGRRHLAIDMVPMAPFGGLQWGSGAKAASKDFAVYTRKWQLSRREAPFGDRHWFQWRHLGAPVGIRRQGGVKRFAVYTPEVAAI
jgi:hypothetical protein